MPGMVLGSSLGVVVAMHPDSSPPLSLVYIVTAVAVLTNTCVHNVAKANSSAYILFFLIRSLKDRGI